MISLHNSLPQGISGPSKSKIPLFKKTVTARTPTTANGSLGGLGARAPPDFFNDDTVVAFAFAMIDASLEDGGMDFEKRQVLSDLPRLIHHQMRVFERLTHAAFRRKITGDHFWAFGIHHL